VKERGQPLKIEISKKVDGRVYYNFLISMADPSLTLVFGQYAKGAAEH